MEFSNRAGEPYPLRLDGLAGVPDSSNAWPSGVCWLEEFKLRFIVHFDSLPSFVQSEQEDTGVDGNEKSGW